MSTGPTHQSMLVLDVEGSGRRTDPEKTALRQNLYQLLMAAFARSGIMWDQCRREDRGDGIYVLVPPTVPKRRLATELVDALDRLVREQEGPRGDGDVPPLRLRLGLHAGEVTFDEEGSSGADVDVAFALVDADVLRATLRAADRGRLAVIHSDAFFRATARHRYPGLDPTTFAGVEIKTKQELVRAWIQVPGYRNPPTVPDSADRSVRPP